MTRRSAPTRSSRRAATRPWCASTARDKALAITTDCTPRYCLADPYEGGKQAIAEAWRNLCAVGARPLAATDCMNFGNPQRPEIMGQFVGCIEGMAEACRALDFPIVSGNVSLYNETKADDGSGSAILPTPAIGGVGLIEDWEKAATIGFKAEGDDDRADRPLATAMSASRSGFASARPRGRPAAAGRPGRRAQGRRAGPRADRRGCDAVHDCPMAAARRSREMALAGGMARRSPRRPHRRHPVRRGSGPLSRDHDDSDAVVAAGQAGVFAAPIGTSAATRSARTARIALADLRRA